MYETLAEDMEEKSLVVCKGLNACQGSVETLSGRRLALNKKAWLSACSSFAVVSYPSPFSATTSRTSPAILPAIPNHDSAPLRLGDPVNSHQSGCSRREDDVFSTREVPTHDIRARDLAPLQVKAILLRQGHNEVAVFVRYGPDWHVQDRKSLEPLHQRPARVFHLQPKSAY